MAPKKEYPYKICNVTSEEDKLIKKCLIGYSQPFVRCGKEGYVMPNAFKKHADQIYNMEVRPDDIWIVTYPRSGTTWTQELIWLLETNLDFKTAKEKPLYERFPMLETTSHIPEIAFNLIKINFMNLGNFQGVGAAARTPSWEIIDNLPSPRLIKTHLPLSLLPPKLLDTAKVVYVARDPRDVIVSYYYLHKMIGKNLFGSTLKDFWNAFRRDLLPCSPIVSHANEAWSQRHHPNLMFLFYEDLIKDITFEIGNLCKFLGRSYTDHQLKLCAEHVSFKTLRLNKKVNNTTDDDKEAVQFVRKGEVGGYFMHFDKEMIIQSENFLSERLQNVDICYPSIPIDLCERSYL